MKTITKVEHILEDGDKTLIFSKLPEDPCKKCDMGIACCGCPNGAKYQERIRPYKEHNVLELAQKIFTKDADGLAYTQKLHQKMESLFKTWQTDLSAKTAANSLLDAAEDYFSGSDQ